MFSLLRITAPLCLVFLAMVSSIASAEKGQSAVHKLAVDGIERSYIVYRPRMFEARNAPLMIVLHGGFGNAKHMEERTGMNAVADSHQFVVVYPDGTGGRLESMRERRTWNAGRCCGQAVEQNVNDVLFINKIIEDVQSKYSIDTRRVYVTGISNGAMMAYRLACEIPDKIAAIIPVSGTLAVDNCDSAKDVPVLHIHGAKDENVPFSGGRGDNSLAGVSHRSVPDAINLIVRSRQCAAREEKHIGSGVQVFSYHCNNGAPVTLYLLKEAGHIWPGGNGIKDNVGNQNISASNVAWEFAKQFSKSK